MKNKKLFNFKLWLLQLCSGQVLVFSFLFLVFIAGGCNESQQQSNRLSNNSNPSQLRAKADRIITAGLLDRDPKIRSNAIEVVAAINWTKFMPKVARLLNDDSVPVRFSAALAVGDLQYRLAENSVRKMLNDKNENVRIAAAYALGQLGSIDSFNLIGKAITSENQTVRANAALLLGKIGDPKALKLLQYAIHDQKSDDKVRFLAAEARAVLGDEKIFPKLWAMLISIYADDRAMGVRAMGALGTENAKNALITMLGDEVPEIRLAAAAELGKLGDTRGEIEVLDVFTKNLTADMDEQGKERINRLTAMAIGQIKTKSLNKFLPQLLNNPSKSVRLAAAKAVFQSKIRY
ncbi:MAG: HEAT repeat domain-containing protein [Planctomycetes bacterium]|nr:HEAT repeat domain-containing protein [Planctomycetota bacterium]